MRQLPIHELAPGMRLGKAVRAAGGQLLLKDGVELTERSIWVLKSWGIPSIWVEDTVGTPDKPAGSDVAPDDRAWEEEIRARFEGTLDHPVMQEIMRVAVGLIHRRRQTLKRGQG